MKKLISLLKACMTNNMNLFRIKSKGHGKISKRIFPVIISLLFLFSIGTYANIIIEGLAKVHLEFVLLSLFVIITAILTLVEGIYKSGNLLFNCKDDNILLSLPVKKSTILFVRIFKFYIFELLYNSLFLLPAMFVYALYVKPGPDYYITSFFMLILLPVIPIVISCIIGALISSFSSKFKHKNITQIIITMVIFIGVFFISSNMENVIGSLTTYATSINDLITKIYYPAGTYIDLILNFNIYTLIVFIFVHVFIFTLLIYVLGKIYFKINSGIKIILVTSKRQSNAHYKVKTNKPIVSLIKKELKRFISSPVFVTNTALGLVMFVVICIAMTVKFDSVVNLAMGNDSTIDIEQIKLYIPVISFGLVCFSSLMSSITSSMISLEGKSFNILKSLPVNPFIIILSKILASVIIMIPFIFTGDLILFIKFKLNFIEILIILTASIVLPLVSETIGIIVNLKYPKMNAENDTEVVKQSMSSMISVLLGMVLLAINIGGLILGISKHIPHDLLIFINLIFYILLYLILVFYLNKNGAKSFNRINV